MKTKYKKFSFEIDDQDPDLTTLIGKNANFVFNPNTKNGEELTDFLSGCKEITDNLRQIQTLEADKAELLEALEYANRMLKNSKDAMYDENYIESLIQKHKR